MSLKRQPIYPRVRSSDQLLQLTDKISMSGDQPLTHKPVRGSARSTKSQSRSSVIDVRSPRDNLFGEKSNVDVHEKTKQALANLLVRKEELESRGIETDVMYKELMNCVSPWRRKKLLQESKESQAALEDALKSVDELLEESKAAFNAYQSMQDSKRKDAAAGDLFWKSKIMHKTMAACIRMACNAESARDQLAWADKIGEVMNSVTSILQILDDLKYQLSKERALTRSLTLMVQREDGSPLEPGAVGGCGDEEGALLPLTVAAAADQRRAAQPELFPSHWSFFRRSRLSLLMAMGLVAAGGCWAAAAADQRLAQLVYPYGGLAAVEPSWPESAQLWLVSLLYGLVCWVPGLCVEQPGGWALPVV